MLRSVPCELLIGGDKLAGRERFTSAGIHCEAHSVSFSLTNHPPTTPQAHRVRRRAGFLHSGPSWLLSVCLAAQQSLTAYGSRSGKVAVIVPVWLVMVSVMSVKVTLPTMTSVCCALGHWKSKSSIVIGSVLTSTVPRPARVLNVASPVVPVAASSSPMGSPPPRVTQPTVATAVADRVAVAVGPAPQTSPVAVKNAPSVLSAVTSSAEPSQTCRPPVDSTVVGATASAGTAARALTMRDNIASIPNFLNISRSFSFSLVGLYYLSLSTYKDVFTLSS